jgi:hypothetical protein
MQDRGDSDGAYEHTEDEALAAVGADIPEGDVQEPSEEDAEDAVEDAQEELEIDEEEQDQMVEAEGISEGAADADVRAEPFPYTATPIEPEQVLHLFNSLGELEEITVADLDSEFSVGFTETGRSPMQDQEIKQNLVSLMDPYFNLMAMMEKGGTTGVAAKAYLEAMHDRFELPPNLSVEAIQFAAEAEAEAAPPEATQGAPPPAEGQPAPGPQAAGGGVTPETQQEIVGILQKAAQLPPDQALQVLGQLFQSDPELSEIIQKAAQMPTEAQAQIVQQIIQQFMGTAQ